MPGYMSFPPSRSSRPTTHSIVFSWVPSRSACSRPLPAAHAHPRRHYRPRCHLPTVDGGGARSQPANGVHGRIRRRIGSGGPRRGRRGCILPTGPTMAVNFGTLVFVVVVVGGLGSVVGALIASLMIGLFISFSVGLNMSIADFLGLFGLEPGLRGRRPAYPTTVPSPTACRSC